MAEGAGCRTLNPGLKEDFPSNSTFDQARKEALLSYSILNKGHRTLTSKHSPERSPETKTPVK
jgi:hypothetical protein